MTITSSQSTDTATADASSAALGHPVTSIAVSFGGGSGATLDIPWAIVAEGDEVVWYTTGGQDPFMVGFGASHPFEQDPTTPAASGTEAGGADSTSGTTALAGNPVASDEAGGLTVTSQQEYVVRRRIAVGAAGNQYPYYVQKLDRIIIRPPPPPPWGYTLQVVKRG